MTEKQREYLLDNELELWMRHDIDQILIDLHDEDKPHFRKNELRVMSEMLANTIYERFQRYDRFSKTDNTDDPDSVYKVERHIVKMYVLSEEEMEGLLSV